MAFALVHDTLVAATLARKRLMCDHAAMSGKRPKASASDDWPLAREGRKLDPSSLRISASCRRGISENVARLVMQAPAAIVSGADASCEVARPFFTFTIEEATVEARLALAPRRLRRKPTSAGTSSPASPTEPPPSATVRAGDAEAAATLTSAPARRESLTGSKAARFVC